MDKLRTDPAFAQAAIMMGARMMQGPRTGQDALGVLGDAAMIGTQAYTFGKQNELEEQRAGERARVQNAQTEAQTAGIQADTTAKVQTTAENELTKPDRVKALRLKAQALERAGKIEEAGMVYEQAKASFKSKYASDPNANVEQLWLDELKQPVEDAKSRRALQGAQTSQATAAAAHQNAETDLTKAKMEDPQKFQPNYSGKNVVTHEMIQKANPTWTPEQVAQDYLRRQGQAKGETITVLKTLAEQGNAEQRKYAVDRLHQMSLEETGGAPAPTGKKPNASGAGGDVTARFRADPSMAGNSLAGPAPNGGMYVKDKSGKIIGTFK